MVPGVCTTPRRELAPKLDCVCPVYAETLWPWRRGLHFLAVQKDEDAEDSAGLWLLQARDLPKI